jgi:hypothetical protein
MKYEALELVAQARRAYLTFQHDGKQEPYRDSVISEFLMPLKKEILHKLKGSFYARKLLVARHKHETVLERILGALHQYHVVANGEKLCEVVILNKGDIGRMRCSTQRILRLILAINEACGNEICIYATAIEADKKFPTRIELR